MNTIKIFYMAQDKENIAIYGVVSCSILTYVAAKNLGRVYDPRERCPEGEQQDPLGTNTAHR